LREGEKVRVHFESGAIPACGPSSEMTAAVPLLGTESTGEPPAAVVRAMQDAGARGAWTAFARTTEADDGMRIWATPDLPCDNPRTKAERVCIVLVREDENRGFFCARPRDVAARGAWFPFPHDDEGRLGVAGMAPTGTAGAATVSRDGDPLGTVPIFSGVFAGLVLGEGGGRIEVRFADGPDLTVLNGTTVAGLASEIGERLPGDERIDNFVDQQVEHTTVYYGHEDGRAVAEHIAGLLYVDRVEPMPDEIAEVVEGGLAVLIGRDMAGPRPDEVGVLEASGGISAETAERLRDRLALDGALHLYPAGERRERSVVRHAPGWERPARDIAERLGIEAVERSGEVTPDQRLGTPIVVVAGADLDARLR
jgi:hypothetical protein